MLATLGAAGAVLTTASGSWAAIPPPTVTRSTVGAGDSSLAGYVLAALRGEPRTRAAAFGRRLRCGGGQAGRYPAAIAGSARSRASRPPPN